jgi:acid stress-induced BolA-like protein IbaG/YrbA
MTPQRIKELIEAGLPGARAFVSGDDGVHFEATVVCEDFTGLSLVKQHQMVYRCLGELLGGEIHALSLKTLTPAAGSA